MTNIVEILSKLFSLRSLEAALRITTPFLLAALGGSFTDHAGIFNIALEGMMLIGAFTAVAISLYTSNWVLALFAGIIIGIIIGMLYALFTVTLKADSIVVGVAFNFFGLGLTTYLMRALFDVKAAIMDPRIEAIPNINIPFFENLGILNILNNHSLLTYVSWVLVFVCWYLIFKTPFGLRLRAAGEHAEALQTAGVSVPFMRYIASIASGVLCALAGVHISLGYLSQFVINISAGRGFIALAIQMFGRSNPITVFSGSLLFGMSESIAIRLQSIGVPGYFALMLPYFLTIMTMVVWAIRRKMKLKVRTSESL